VRDHYIAQHPHCELCGAPGIDVHHLDGRNPREPSANDWSNLGTRCRSCHRRETEHAKRDRAAPSVTATRRTPRTPRRSRPMFWTTLQPRE
jgi:HNH endonuclease